MTANSPRAGAQSPAESFPGKGSYSPPVKKRPCQKSNQKLTIVHQNFAAFTNRQRWGATKSGNGPAIDVQASDLFEE